MNKINDTINIFLVENNKNDSLSLSLALSGSNNQVLTFYNAETVIEHLLRDDSKCDIIISDNNLPGISGIDFLKQFKLMGIDIPFIILTGTEDKHIAVEALKSGADDYLIKDVKCEYLEVIHNLVINVIYMYKEKKARRLAENQLKEAQVALQEINEQLELKVQKRTKELLLINTQLEREIDERINIENQLKRLNRIHSMLSENNHAIVRIKDKSTLLKETCRIAVETGKLRMVWFGEVDYKLRKVIPVVSHGKVNGYLDNINVSIDEIPEGRGPTGKAVRERKHTIFNDIENNTDFSVWKENAAKRKYRSVASFPIYVFDVISGVISYYSDEKYFFNVEETDLLIQMSKDISFALEAMKQQELQKKSDELVNKLLDIIEQSPVIIVITDTQGYIEYVNPKFSSITGYSKEEVTGKKLNILKSHEMPEEFYENIWKNVATGQEWKGDISNKTKEGKIYWEYATIFPLRDKKGKITNYLKVAEDLTERKRLEQQLIQAQKMEAIGQLAGGVAHDFNNMLFIVSNYIYLLYQDIDKNSDLMEYLDGINTSIERAKHLTQSLLSFSRKQIIEPTIIDLNVIIKNLDQMLTRLTEDDISLNLSLCEKELLIYADITQIEQIILNLVTNARDAILPGGGKIHLITDLAHKGDRNMDSSPCAMLVFSDTGAGIPKNIQDKIYDPFFTTKEVGKGTGLGLSTVYGAVKQNKGEIFLHSEPNVGTTFKIYFPLVNEDKTITNKYGNSKPLVGTETILFADDDEHLRLATKKLLESNGYKVIEALDGEDVINKFIAEPDGIDLLIINAIMPGKNGIEVYNAIKELKSDIKILYCSGYSYEHIVNNGLLEQDIPCMGKPVDPMELLSKVRQVLER